MKKPVLVVLTLLACGRTGTLQSPDPQQPMPKPTDTTEQPLFVFTGDNCPKRGTEADLKPEKLDGLALVQMTAQGECSNAGGDWLIGREVGSSRDFFVGAHTCWFRPMELEPAPAGYFAVVRYSQTAALFHAPMGWCITDANGEEPVTTDSKNIAWGVYPTEKGARAAFEKLKQR